MSVVKNKLGVCLRESKTLKDADVRLSFDAHLHHAISFLAFHHLLDHGYHAFAIGDQCRGVVARQQSALLLEVCALRNCVINQKGVSYVPISPLALPHNQRNFWFNFR